MDVPDKTGSSENDSKDLPPSGERWMLQVGASKTVADFAFASSARNIPTLDTSSGSKVAAKHVAHYECQMT
jgi:hypothetical protein